MVCSAASFRLQATTSMVVFSFSSSPTILSLIPNSLSTSLPVPGKIKCPKPAAIVLLNHGFGIHERNETHKLRALTVASAAADPAQAEITWQIVVGALAGVVPFVVAGIEFSKRIVAQQKCKVCGGSGLVLRENYYFRCPGCGGFLPWQSWKRFFSG